MRIIRKTRPKLHFLLRQLPPGESMEIFFYAFSLEYIRVAACKIGKERDCKIIVSTKEVANPRKSCIVTHVPEEEF